MWDAGETTLSRSSSSSSGYISWGVIPMPWSGPGQVNMKRKGLLAAFVLGLIFGIALGPCTFAYMAPMLGGCLQPLQDGPSIWRLVTAGLRPGTLRGNRPGRDLHGTGAAIPQLE